MSYQLTVTAEQAATLRDACELLARCRLGQIADACQEVLDAQGQATVPHEAPRPEIRLMGDRHVSAV